MSHLEFLNERRSKALLAIKEHLQGLDGFTMTPGDGAAAPVVLHTTLEAKDQEWEVELTFPDEFPDEPPKICVPKARENYLKKPHILGEGNLCIIDETAWINAERPVEVLNEILRSTKKILEGTPREDFRDEFHAYWWRGKEFKRCCIYAVDPPESLTTPFYVSCTDEFLILAKTMDRMKAWYQNYKGKEIKKDIIKNGICLILEKPMLPEEYPKNLNDLMSLSGRSNDKKAHALLGEHIAHTSEPGFVLISQKSNAGFMVAGALFSGVALSHQKKLNAGFRKGKMPVPLLLKKGTSDLIKAPLERYRITRVDHDYVHARGADTGNYKNKRVMVIGCGSLGGYVAHFLSRAGVGHLNLLDNDTLKPENLGRHILGAESWNLPKAEALSHALQKQMPHLEIYGNCLDWREALHKNPRLFDSLDLIVVTVADLRCELPLNELARAKGLPSIIYGWLESYAIAGHCLMSVPGSGCRACGIDHQGNWANRVGHFEKGTLKKEPGGCAYYQEYGPAALLPIAAMISNSALKALNQPPTASLLSTWVSDAEHLKRASAQLHGGWKDKEHLYSRIHTQLWETQPSCAVCCL